MDNMDRLMMKLKTHLDEWLILGNEPGEDIEALYTEAENYLREGTRSAVRCIFPDEEIEIQRAKR